jgi:glycine cleavage system transcriptional repressor
MDERWIAVTAVGRDRPGIVARVTEVMLGLGCNLGETSMARLRGEFAMILLVRLSERGDVAKVRTRLRALAGDMALTVTARELESDEFATTHVTDISYILRVYGADRPGIVHAVTSLLADHELNITDLETRVVPGEGGLVYVMVLELTALSEERGEAVREGLNRVAAEMGIEVSYERLDEETL